MIREGAREGGGRWRLVIGVEICSTRVQEELHELPVRVGPKASLSVFRTGKSDAGKENNCKASVNSNDSGSRDSWHTLC